MFDTYKSEVVHNDSIVRVTEHRAPTDASVRLLKEMESAALAKIVEAMRLKNNLIDGVVHRQDIYTDMTTVFLVHYKVNGKNRQVKVVVTEFSTIQERMEQIYEAVAKNMTAFLLSESKVPL